MEEMIGSGNAAPLGSYTEAVDWINGLIPFGIRPGLERIELLMEKLGNPHRRLKFIHVAGTNGKGSTCAFLTSVLLKSGYSVGTFTSPYITKFTNRFQYNGTDIPEDTLTALAEKLRPLVEEIAAGELGSPTMFEVATALAILYYAECCFPDVVVWETGLGGRLDVTNIVLPVVSVITNVGHDHTDVLGDTLEKIAFEKAGIIKPGVPVVSCVSQPEVISVLKAKAEASRSTLYLAGEDFSYALTGIEDGVQRFSFKGPFRPFEVGIAMKGEHQLSNAAGAMMVLEVLRQYMAFVLDDEAVLEGFRDTFWAGRLEEVSSQPRIVLDGAHNPEGAESLARSLPQFYQYGKLNLLMGMLANKHHESYFKHILPIVDTLILTEPDFRKKMDAEELQAIAERLREKYAKSNLEIIVERNWGKALQLLQSITSEKDLAVVSGTLYLISDVRSTLCSNPILKKAGDELLDTTERVHFIGIGGYGMSAIARVMLEMGYTVTGSDVAAQELTEKLIAKGAKVYIGHTAEQVKGADLVVYSTALASDNVEWVEAERLNIPVLHRSQMLARLLNERKGVAVAGAHGKTTTSSMIALIMEDCGVDPTYIIGGEIMNVGTNAKAGQGEFVVAEADESDGSFLQYHPWLAIVTNIEADHLENYGGDFGKLKAAYVQFMNQLREDGTAIVCADDETASSLLSEVKGSIITYGIDSPDADYTATDIVLGDRQVAYTMNHQGQVLGKIELSIPGKYNLYNSMAAVIACLKSGIAFEAVAAAIVKFHGAKRRFQVLGELNDILVIDDYAHHPTEIQATISAAKATGKKIIAVFQPQRYTRTFFLLDAFSRAFSEADEVIITDIYSPAGEKQIEGVTSARLVELIVQNSNSSARHLPTKEAVLADLQGRIAPGDLVLTMGAGDIWKVGYTLAEGLREHKAKE